MIVLPEPRNTADFALTDQNGNPFSLAGFKGHWSVLFFGYTSCPDVCPNTLYQLQQARQLMLQQQAADKIPRIYLVSVDPARDTPQKLAEYLHYFDPAFIGLSGEEHQLQALALQLGVVFFVEPHAQGSVQYNVDHSASLLVLDPQGRLHGVMPVPYQASSIAHDVLTVISQERSTPWD
jgi:protein SCO1/2